jgi:hypothetical protein
MNIGIEAQSLDFPGVIQSSPEIVDNFVDKLSRPSANPCGARLRLACLPKEQDAEFI